MEEVKCRYCWMIPEEMGLLNKLVYPCQCHDPICLSCLHQWIAKTSRDRCEICCSELILPDLPIERKRNHLAWAVIYCWVVGGSIIIWNRSTSAECKDDPFFPYLWYLGLDPVIQGCLVLGFLGRCSPIFQTRWLMMLTLLDVLPLIATIIFFFERLDCLSYWCDDLSYGWIILSLIVSFIGKGFLHRY